MAERFTPAQKILIATFASDIAKSMIAMGDIVSREEWARLHSAMQPVLVVLEGILPDMPKFGLRRHIDVPPASPGER